MLYVVLLSHSLFHKKSEKLKDKNFCVVTSTWKKRNNGMQPLFNSQFASQHVINFSNYLNSFSF